MCRCSDVAQWCRWGEVKWSELSAGVYIQLGWLEISTQLQPKADWCSCRLCRGPCLGWICACQTVCLGFFANITTSVFLHFKRRWCGPYAGDFVMLILNWGKWRVDDTDRMEIASADDKIYYTDLGITKYIQLAVICTMVLK